MINKKVNCMGAFFFNLKSNYLACVSQPLAHEVVWSMVSFLLACATLFRLAALS